MGAVRYVDRNRRVRLFDTGQPFAGAFLAIGVAALFLGIKSGRPILMTAAFLLALAGAVALMPENWTNRMETIESFQSDASAQSRLKTWETIWNMVQSRPIVGAGFDLANPQMYQTYSSYPDLEFYGAHSIYIQALGEHGFVGLGLRACQPATTLNCPPRLRRQRAKEQIGAIRCDGQSN